MAMSRSFGSRSVTTCRSMMMSPDDADSSPEMMPSSVDLPQPEGPSSTRNSPWRASRSIFLRTWTAPKLFSIEAMWSTAYPLTEPIVRPRMKYFPAKT